MFSTVYLLADPLTHSLDHLKHQRVRMASIRQVLQGRRRNPNRQRVRHEAGGDHVREVRGAPRARVRGGEDDGDQRATLRQQHQRQVPEGRHPRGPRGGEGRLREASAAGRPSV